MSKQKKKPMWQKDFDDLQRASFQIDGKFHLYRHIRESGGTVVFQWEDYRGNVLGSAIDPTISFEQWIGQLIGAELHKEAS